MEKQKVNEPILKLIDEVSNETGIDSSIIEKDYYVTLFLKEMNHELPEVIFKGGTSLSKCYGIIQRFSEDIDLSVINPFEYTSGMYKKLSRTIIDIGENRLGMTLTNRDNIRSRRKFNRYIFTYEARYPNDNIPSQIIVETSLHNEAIPFQEKEVRCILNDYLKSCGKDFLIQPFAMHTQSIVRTVVDKTFAIADYYLKALEKDDESILRRNSRHLYDIVCLLKEVELNEDFVQLMRSVRISRFETGGKMNPSSHPNCNLIQILNEVLEKDIYKEDFNRVTKVLLYEDVTYEEIKQQLIEYVNELEKMKVW